MMTKKVIDILFILFFLFVGSINGKETIQQKINKIDIFVQNLNLSGDVLYCPSERISCMDFFNHVADMECYSVNDKAKITQLLSCLNNLASAEAERIDVKCKILFYSSDTLIYSACIGESKTLFDGFYYKNTEELKNILFDVIKNSRSKKIKIPNSNKNVIVNGKSILSKRLKKISEEINVDLNIYIRGICKADKNGKIVFVKLVQNPFVISNINRRVREIERTFRKKIKFNKNKERMVSDVIPITIKVTKNIVYSNLNFN